MKTIWKFPIAETGARGVLTDSPTVTMPAGAQILTMQLQNGTPTIWALVDTEAMPVLRELVIVGTGAPVEDGLSYVGTWQAPGYRDNTFVFHVFERSLRDLEAEAMASEIMPDAGYSR